MRVKLEDEKSKEITYRNKTPKLEDNSRKQKKS